MFEVIATILKNKVKIVFMIAEEKKKKKPDDVSN